MLKIEKKDDYEYDLISLGEVMLRMDPVESRVRCAREFKVYEGGGEYNVARSLRKCFRMKTAVITSLVNNDVGLLIEDLMCQGGVDTSMVCWIGNTLNDKYVRNGLNFTERGFGIRGALGISDRKYTAASMIKPDTFDWETIFRDHKIRWFHTGGIFAALSPDTSDTVIRAVRCAKKHGIPVSYDLNYRPSLWNDNGGMEHAHEVNGKIARYVDVIIGNEEDYSACLGFETGDSSGNYDNLDINDYCKMVERVSKKYENLELIATTLRTVKSASLNDWTALAYYDNKIYKAKDYYNLEILDRVGGGDSFAAGLVYGLLSDKGVQYALECGTSHGVLAMTTPGDASMASVDEVEKLMHGGGARIKR